MRKKNYGSVSVWNIGHQKVGFWGMAREVQMKMQRYSGREESWGFLSPSGLPHEGDNKGYLSVTGWNGERLTAGGKTKLRSIVLHKKARERRELQGRGKGKLSPSIGRAGGRSQEGFLKGDETEQETHVCEQLCRWLQPKWEICIIFGYLAGYILKMMSGRLKLWNRKVSHFLATRTQAVNTPLFAITADGSHGTHSSECLIFPAQPDWLETHTGGAEGAGSPAPLSDEWDSFDGERKAHLSGTEEYFTVSGHPGHIRTFDLLPAPAFCGNCLNILGAGMDCAL